MLEELRKSIADAATSLFSHRRKSEWAPTRLGSPCRDGYTPGMSERTQRRLAAIVSADVVGYSRLMGADETGTLAALNAHRSELIDPLVAKHGGRIVKTMGDGLLLEFPSVVAAVECVIEAQTGLAERNADVAADEAIQFRVGVHLGDVIVEGDDIFGDGVNVAARLEGLSEANAMALSDDAYRQVRDRLDADREDGGEHEVKNIARPVHVWRWSAQEKQSLQGTDVVSEALALPDKPSIAVLPFANMSGDPEQEYFSDGISEDIITALFKVHWLFVIARNSTFTYKGSAIDVARVAKELGVRYVVEGSVRKAGNKVRITAQLIDGTNGNHVWAERYDRELDDIFALQDEITETIVGRIDTELRFSEMDRARRKPPANLDAWELYQRGLWHNYKVTTEDNEAARNLFQKAVERDPNFAVAHAGIALTCFREINQGYGDNLADRLAQGLAAGEQAVALDDKDGSTHFALGRVLLLAGQGDRAIAELEKSVALYPSFAHGYFGLGHTLNWYGRAAEGITWLDMAMRLSPHDPSLWAMQTIRATCCINLKNYDEAVEWARKSANSDAKQFWPHIHMASALVGQGRQDEARTAIETARRLKPDLSLSVMKRTQPNYYPEYIERRIHFLREAGLPEE